MGAFIHGLFIPPTNCNAIETQPGDINAIADYTRPLHRELTLFFYFRMVKSPKVRGVHVFLLTTLFILVYFF